MRIRTTIRLIIALMLLAAVATWVWRQQQEAPQEKPPMWQIEAGDVESLRLRRDDGTTARFERLGEAGWRGGDERRINAALLLLAAPEAARLIAEEAGEPATYGLAEPALEVELEGVGIRPMTILIGDASPDGRTRYVMREGTSAVHAVPASWFESLSLLLPPRKAEP